MGQKTHKGRFMSTALLPMLPVLLPVPVLTVLLLPTVLRNRLRSTSVNILKASHATSQTSNQSRPALVQGSRVRKWMVMMVMVMMTHSWRWRPCCPLSRLVTTSQLHLLLSSAPPALVHCQMGPEGQDLINLPPPQPSFSS